MGIRMHFVSHPKTRCTSSARLREDGLWEFPDGATLTDEEIRRQCDCGGSAIGLMIAVYLAVYFWFRIFGA